MVRTIRILGWGTGQSPATLTASLDGETVFSGKVDLVELSDANQSAQTAPTLFSFDVPPEFAGTKRLKITVADALVRFAHIVGNYTVYDTGAGIYKSNEDEYLDISVFDSDGVRDARSNVSINGIKQTVDRSLGKGSWHWFVPPGSTLEHDVNIPTSSLEIK
jgi:hypothetical protein